ncbi:30S ribosomal protein S8 [Acidimicrobium ferrooxidans]|uniref:Small ribosomal subunit protein uS8 n=1 Tax=Acidimicrobium ferrooxidans TaxID=53635 RepID=A0ABS3APY5_9ACTN|nr:30S ribosomal protein S8 [Acidimicrobium ferrooxidans]
MTMTDPIADMLTRIRNASSAQKDAVSMPSSKVRVALAGVLQKEGYIESFNVDLPEGAPQGALTIDLKYTPDRDQTISGITRVSKPGLRVYSQSSAAPRVLGGLGIAVLSTSQGLMTDREARRRRVGGEVLCYVW